MRWRIGKCGTGGGGRQARDVDIVFDRNRDSVQRQQQRVLARERFGFLHGVLFIAQADEDSWIVVVANADKTARHGLRRR